MMSVAHPPQRFSCVTVILLPGNFGSSQEHLAMLLYESECTDARGDLSATLLSMAVVLKSLISSHLIFIIV